MILAPEVGIGGSTLLKTLETFWKRDLSEGKLDFRGKGGFGVVIRGRAFTKKRDFTSLSMLTLVLNFAAKFAVPRPRGVLPFP